MTDKSVETKETLTLDKKLIMSYAPHIKSDASVQRIMLDVIIALIPAIIASVVFYGIRALTLILVSVVSAVASEALIQKIFKKEVRISDLSAVVTGILVAFNVPANLPWYMVVFGSAFAIIIAKEMFGGIGSNFVNPALAARGALMASWPTEMTTFVNADMVSTATPLALMKAGNAAPSIQRLLIGDIAGSIGEISAIALLIGGAYLLIRKVIDWKVPVTFIGSTAIMLLLLKVDPILIPTHLLSGGLLLGAIFMATDYATMPVTPLGRIIFGIGCGVLTAIFRIKGSMPEGVSYAILLMNIATPVIERFTKPKVFGEVK